MGIPLPCLHAIHDVHSELIALGRSAAELAIATARQMEIPIEEARDLAVNAVTIRVIEAYQERDHPKLRAILDEMVKHARHRIEELIREQQACDSSTAAL